MAGWGGAERPKAPMAGEEETGRGRAIGAPGSRHPPPYVTFLPAAHFQATGRGREQVLGCPGKLYYLRRGDQLQGAVRSLGRASRRDMRRSRTRAVPRARGFADTSQPALAFLALGISYEGRTVMSILKRDGWTLEWSLERGVLESRTYLDISGCTFCAPSGHPRE